MMLIVTLYPWQVLEKDLFHLIQQFKLIDQGWVLNVRVGQISQWRGEQLAELFSLDESWIRN